MSKTNLDNFGLEQLKKLIEMGAITIDELLDAVIEREAPKIRECTISDLVNEGYPRKRLEEIVKGEHSKQFAHRTSERGTWIINYRVFKRLWDEGKFEKAAKKGTGRAG